MISPHKVHSLKALLVFLMALISHDARCYASDSIADQLVIAQVAYPPSGGPQSEVEAVPAYTLPLMSHQEATPASLPPSTPPAAFIPTGYVEIGGNFHSVTNHFGNWSGEYVKGEIRTDASNSWNSEIVNQREFGATGVYADIGNTHSFNEYWYTSITAGAGNGGIYLPRYRLDAFLNRKWADIPQLITTVGFGAYKAMDAHSDNSVFLGAAYYFSIPWIIQGGARFNISRPGNIGSVSQFIAVTQGKNKQRLITARYGFGEEAYQIIGAGRAVSDFHSQQLSLDIRQWVSDDWGLDVRGEEYYNPHYHRTGISLGVFKEF